jgi:hypothetical protein
VVALFDVVRGVVAADGAGLLCGCDNGHRGRGGKEGTTHSRHHSPTKAIWIATVVISTGLVRQLRNLWRNRRKLPNRRSRDGSGRFTTVPGDIDPCWRCWREAKPQAVNGDYMSVFFRWLFGDLLLFWQTGMSAPRAKKEMMAPLRRDLSCAHDLP